MPENTVAQTNGENAKKPELQENEEESDPHYEPIVSLPVVDVSNNEENEVELIRLRAKLYRYDSSSNPGEWKERGTGDVKLLRHNTVHTVRVVMRREKTLKICANHFITPWMEMKPNCGSDRAWVWSVLADYADEKLTSELLAIKFANAENAQLWKEAFENAKKIVETECAIYSGKDDDNFGNSHCDTSDEAENDKHPTEKEASASDNADKVAEKLKKLDVEDKEQDGK